MFPKVCQYEEMKRFHWKIDIWSFSILSQGVNKEAKEVKNEFKNPRKLVGRFEVTQKYFHCVTTFWGTWDTFFIFTDGGKKSFENIFEPVETMNFKDNLSRVLFFFLFFVLQFQSSWVYLSECLKSPGYNLTLVQVEQKTINCDSVSLLGLLGSGLAGHHKIQWQW